MHFPSFKDQFLLKTVALVFFFSLAQTSFSQRIYVSAAATGLNNGSSWINAYTDLQDAFDEFGISEIWVAQGIYTPSREPEGQPDTKKRTFYIGFENKQIYGGFNGTETMLSQRDPRKNLTRLSGANNSYHVMITADLSKTSIIDGFTFRQGNANDVGVGAIIFSGNTYLARNGGGMYNYKSSPQITNCIFENNFATGGGGGMYNRESSPTLTNCSFISNSTDNSGGGIENFVSSSPILVNCTFLSNTATEGGGMYNYQTLSTATFTNCSFANNSATSDGGAIYNSESSPQLINCTISSNTAEGEGGGMNNNFIASDAPAVITISNSIVSGNTAGGENNISNNTSKPSISSSIIGESGGSTSWNPAFGTDGGNNLDLDPLFTNATDPDGLDDILGTIDDGLRLSVNSPAVDAGVVVTANVTDILGNPRNYNGAVDIGAYEFQGMPFITTWITSDGQITIPTIGDFYKYDLVIVNESNPLNVFSLSNQTSNATVTGLTNGATYRVEIIGDFPRIYFNSESEKDKIQSIEQWGDIVWTSMEKAFDGCANLTYNAIDTPNLSMVTNMTFMFSGATRFNGAIDSWDVSGVTDFSAMFVSAISFNQDISSWDMSAAKSINSMFNSATNFNQDISGWNVSSVESMNGTFNGATQFNQPIGLWNVRNVKEMRLTFNNASSFNQPLDSWNTSSCTIFFRMFEGATSFDQSLGSFDITNVSGSNLTRMLENSGLSFESYDATLNGWSSQEVQSDLAFQANGMTYSSIGKEGRDILTDTFDWIITGDEFINDEEVLFKNDSLALAALYTSTTGANWINRSNWLTSELSTWFGVTVADGRVTQLELPDNNLKGNVPERLQ